MTAADRKLQRAQVKLLRALIKRIRAKVDPQSHSGGRCQVDWFDLDALLRWTEELCQSLETKT